MTPAELKRAADAVLGTGPNRCSHLIGIGPWDFRLWFMEARPIPDDIAAKLADGGRHRVRKLRERIAGIERQIVEIEKAVKGLET